MADPRVKFNNKRVNVPMPATTASMLEKLSTGTKRSKSQIIRESIVALFRMKYANEPRCADCSLCKCPQMHTVQAPGAISDEDLLAKTDTDNDNAEHSSAA